jgi:hypothetical protein
VFTAPAVDYGASAGLVQRFTPEQRLSAIDQIEDLEPFSGAQRRRRLPRNVHVRRLVFDALEATGGAIQTTQEGADRPFGRH